MTDIETQPGAEPSPERNETPAERHDRNWNELLQEMRVTQTGIQILSGFLLTLPFQARFTELQPPLVWVFLLAALFGTLSTALLVAPVVAHRLHFRHHVKNALVDLANVLTKAGLAGFACTVSLVVTLLLGFLAGIPAGVVGGIVSLLAFVGLWILAPLSAIRSGARPADHRP